MGLRGIGAKQPKTQNLGPAPWDEPGLTDYERVVCFVESLTITSGKLAGEPFKLRPFQHEFLKSVYRTKNLKRQVRSALLTLPKKNGKTGLCAAVGLCHLCGPMAVPRGQIVSAAADRAQAALIHAEMSAFADTNPLIHDRLIFRDFKKQIQDSITGSVYSAISSDARRQHGKSGSLILCDEVGSWHGSQLFEALSTSQGAWESPLFITLSTQNADSHSVMSELVRYGKGVLAGEIDDPTFHATIFEAPTEADVWDERVWHECNPALGDYRSLEDMRDLAGKAKRMPARESAFRLYFLNQPTQIEDRFINQREWNDCERDIPLEQMEGRSCFGGLDLSSTRDLTSLALVFPLEDGTMQAYVWTWCPQDTILQKEETDHVPYATWERQGHLTTTPGKAIDKEFIVHTLSDLNERFDMQVINYDRWRIDDMKKLLADGNIELNLQPIGQGYKDMSPAVDSVETDILNKALFHQPNPILKWAASNAVCAKDPAGGRKLDKAKSYQRIDPLVALTMAVAAAHKGEPENDDYLPADWTPGLMVVE